MIKKRESYCFVPFHRADHLSRLAELAHPLEPVASPARRRYQRLVHQTIFENGRLVAKARLEKELDEIEEDLAKLTKGPVAIAP